jgi:hypothetical protein
VFKVNALEIEVGGRMQMQFNTTSVESEPETEWLLRRVRLEAKVKVNDLVSGKIQPDFAGDRVRLKDAYLKLTFSPAFQVLAGQAYRPFSVLEQTSSTRILPIERGADVRGIPTLDEYEIIHDLEYSDREIGLQFLGQPTGAPLGLEYAVGVFRSPLQGETGSEDSQQFAARATVTPYPRLRVGVGWSSRDFASPADSLSGGFDLKRGNAWEIDAEYGSFAPGLHLLGEIAFGDYDPFTGDDFFGAQAWLAYRTEELSPRVAYFEPILRLSHGDVDDDDLAGPRGGGTLVTPGFNVGLGGLNRFMLNYDVWVPDGDADAERSFKAMFQLAF